ncbi:MAG: MarR family transcriptional regulator [Planctomycetota bacterium]
MSQVQAVRESFVQLWASMAPFWGVPPAAARVHAWLISMPRGATADELVAGLSMSRGAVSMACRELRAWGLIQPERAAGSRQVCYRPETDLGNAIRSIVQARKRREWDPVLRHLREWIPALAADRSAEAGVFRERLAAIAALVALADAMAESFLKGGIVPRLGLKVLVAAANRKRARSRP